jgi:transposase InsO family protein
VKSKVYLNKDASTVNVLQWALRAGRIPREIYLDNGKQFVFKAEAQKDDIKLIFGRPYNPLGCGKIERYPNDSLPGTHCS